MKTMKNLLMITIICLAILMITAVFVNQFTVSGAKGQLIVARFLYSPGEAEDLGAGAFFGAEGVVPVGAFLDDQGDIAESFHVVDHSGFAVQAICRGERWAQAGLAQLAFHRL